MSAPTLLPTGLPAPLPAPATAEQLEALARDLRAAGLTPLRSAGELDGLAADAFVYSPVLQPLLQGRRAQIGVRPSQQDQVPAIAAACARHGISLTLRGAGTGNYGQCVPLAGGLVLDCSGLNRLLDLDPTTGVFTAEPGLLLGDLEQQLQLQGREPRLLPSTVRSASLGGFVAGGASGIGSLRWGFLRDPGHLLGLEIVSVETEPRRLQLDARAAQPLNHAYGSNGIVTSLTMASAAAVPWQQLVIAFPSWDTALLAAQRLPASALLLQELCLLEAPLAALMPWPQGCPPADGTTHRLLLLTAPEVLPVLGGWLPDLGGALCWQAPQGQSRGIPLRELCWNHTTLHARSRDGDLTYLQLMLPQPEGPALAALRARWGDDLLWHLEGVRSFGAQRLACLPLVRWRGREALEELITQARGLGCLLFNPHVLTVEDGGLGVVDADQVAAKGAYDPAGLLNPGKLRGWL
ncbi:MAG: FAD-binding oxidoreductase, partial [Vulcanococcus sp.]